jgi:hypothetical protein
LKQAQPDRNITQTINRKQPRNTNMAIAIYDLNKTKSLGEEEMRVVLGGYRPLRTNSSVSTGGSGGEDRITGTYYPGYFSQLGLKLGDIRGDSQDKGHTNWINVS